MSTPFNSSAKTIVVSATIHGPNGSVLVELVLDTGATRTIVNEVFLVQLGYDLSSSTRRGQMTTANGTASVPLIAVDKLEALGQESLSLMVVAHTLPPSATSDGLLGLDFFRGRELRIDFRAGTIDLT